MSNRTKPTKKKIVVSIVSYQSGSICVVMDSQDKTDVDFVKTTMGEFGDVRNNHLSDLCLHVSPLYDIDEVAHYIENAYLDYLEEVANYPTMGQNGSGDAT